MNVAHVKNKILKLRRLNKFKRFKIATIEAEGPPIEIVLEVYANNSITDDGLIRMYVYVEKGPPCATMPIGLIECHPNDLDRKLGIIKTLFITFMKLA